MRFRRMLGRVVTLIDVPFGYTLTVWGSGTLMLARFGQPSLLGIFLFIVGAVGAYLVCDAAASRETAELGPLHLRTITTINVISILATAIVVATTLPIRNPAAAFAVAGFVATLAYILSLSALMYLAQQLARKA